MCDKDLFLDVLASSDTYYSKPDIPLNISWQCVDLVRVIPAGAWPSGEFCPLRILELVAQGCKLASAETHPQGSAFVGSLTYFNPTGINFAKPVTITYLLK